MNRRHLLEWFSRGLATVVAVAIGLPGFRYILGSITTSAAAQADFQRLKRLQDLPVGKPVLVPVIGSKQDGWTRSNQEVVGRIWIVRESDSATDDTGSPAVKAYSSVCPHMGCQIQAQAGSQGFVCPCHRASFQLNGSRQADPKSGEPSPAPRNMDDLECRVMPDAETGDAWIEVKFEKFVTGLEQRVVRG